MEPITDIRPIREDREGLFVEQLPLIQRLTRAVARQYRLNADEAEEFAAIVHLRLIADDYAVLRKFRRQCSLPSYLTVVIQRMCLDFRIAQWGKWRASAASRRRGDAAIKLERLTMRDGLTFDEACAVLEGERGVAIERETLARIYSQFRVRARPRFVGADELGGVEALHGSPDRPIIEAEQAEELSRVISALAGAIRTLTPRDQRLLQLRFGDDLPVATIARIVRVNQKWLYRRYVQLFTRLRKQLASRGIAARQIVPLIGAATVDTARVFCPRTASARIAKNAAAG